MVGFWRRGIEAGWIWWFALHSAAWPVWVPACAGMAMVGGCAAAPHHRASSAFASLREGDGASP